MNLGLFKKRMGTCNLMVIGEFITDHENECFLVFYGMLLINYDCNFVTRTVILVV